MSNESNTDISNMNVRREQNICGCIFVCIYVLNVAIQLLTFTGLIPAGMSWHVTPLAVLAIIGFVFLYRLSSTPAGEIFAGSMIGCELFFSFVMPFLFREQQQITQYYIMSFWACIVFCIFSVYVFTMLYYNSNFKRRDFRWVIFLPMPYICNICYYWSNLQIIDGSDSPLTQWVMSNILYMPILWVLMIFVGMGYWRLSHSEAFSGYSNNLRFPSWNPLNRYALAFGIVIALIFCIF